MVKIYFAHPINTYGTQLEQKLLHIIVAMCGLLTSEDIEIVNPSDKRHADVVKKLKESDPNANVMPYFTALVHDCDVVVALPFPDGMWGAGVYAEAAEMLERLPPRRVFVLDPIGTFIPVFTLNPALRLSVDETRSRVYFPDRTIRPYQ